MPNRPIQKVARSAPRRSNRRAAAEDGTERAYYSAVAIAGDVVKARFARDHAIARLAELQHGLVTRAQLRVIGLGEGAIATRVARARLHRVHRGVYRVGHTAPLPLAREMGAVLACGDGAVLSHGAAMAAAWRLAPEDGSEVDITVSSGGGRRHRPGIRVHRSTLSPDQVDSVQGVPVTSPARTLIDVAATAPPLLLERAVEEARRRRLVSTASLVRALDRSPARRGSALRALLRDEQGPALTRSAAKERLVELLRAAGLPAPDHNVRVGPYELDVVWRDARLAVEIDGFAYHSSRAAFERDRRRDAELVAAGWTVIRVTWRQLVDEPEAVIARLAAALARAVAG